MPRIKWNGRRVFKNTKKIVESNMEKAVEFAEKETMKIINRSNVSGDNPSNPFEPPKRVTGTLRSNIGSATRTTRTQVIGTFGVKRGPANDYARRLELGFTGTDSLGRVYDQKPRPYLRPILRTKRKQLLKIIKAKR